MTWNNRIIRKIQRNPIKNGSPKVLHFYDIHEVYYDKKGQVNGWTENPIIGGFESVKDLRSSLAQILRDVLISPVVEIKKVNKKDVLVERRGSQAGD